MFFSVVVALALRYWGGLSANLYIYTLSCTSDKCVGIGAVYRVSFAIFLFFVLHCLLLLCAACAKFDSGFWPLKLFALAVFVVGAWMLPTEFYDGYAHVARVVSAIFLVLQIMFLIDFAYRWNEDWTSDEKNWKAPVLIVSLLMYCACLVFLVLFYIYFGGSGCKTNQFFISFTLVFTLAFTVLSVSNAIEHGAILPSAVVTLYMYYLLYSAMASDPGGCNPVQSDEKLGMILGLFIAAASVTYAGWSLANSAGLFKDDSDDDGASDFRAVSSGVSSDPEAPSEAKSGGADDAEEEQEARDQANRKKNLKFHFVMAAAAMYMAMLLTSWGSRQQAEAEDTGDESETAYDLNTTSMWIKIGTQWATGLLYTWTLIAPYVLKNRDFS